MRSPACRSAWGAMPRAALLALVTLSACTIVHERAGGTEPVSRPGEESGTVVYRVGKLEFQVPLRWAARGDSLRVIAVHPEEQGRLEVQQAGAPLHDRAECLARAEETLQRGSAGAAGVRRHPTTFAGQAGLALEGDQGAWHGWAWAICDGGIQYRISFFGLTPLRDDVMAAWNGLVKSARLQP